MKRNFIIHSSYFLHVSYLLLPFFSRFLFFLVYDPQYIDPGITTFYFGTIATQRRRMMRKQTSSLATEEQIRRFTHRPGQGGISGARLMHPTQVAHLAHTLVGK